MGYIMRRLKSAYIRSYPLEGLSQIGSGINKKTHSLFGLKHSMVAAENFEGVKREWR